MHNKTKRTDFSQEYLTVTETETYIKCSRPTVWLLRKQGKIDSVRVGKKRVLIIKDSIDNYLKLNTLVACNG